MHTDSARDRDDWWTWTWSFRESATRISSQKSSTDVAEEQSRTAHGKLNDQPRLATVCSSVLLLKGLIYLLVESETTAPWEGEGFKVARCKCWLFKKKIWETHDQERSLRLNLGSSEANSTMKCYPDNLDKTLFYVWWEEGPTVFQSPVPLTDDSGFYF